MTTLKIIFRLLIATLIISLLVILWYVLDKNKFEIKKRVFQTTELHDETNRGATPGPLKWKDDFNFSKEKKRPKQSGNSFMQGLTKGKE